MNKGVKITLKVVGWIFAVLLIVLVIAFIWLYFNAGRLAKNYLEEHSEELIGRKLTLSQVELKPFSGWAQLDSLTIKEKDGKTDFLTFDSLNAQVKLLDLIGHELTIEHVHLNGADVVVKQRNSTFNFSDIIEKLTAEDTTSTAEADTSAPFLQKYNIHDIQLNHCSAHYSDLVMGSNFNMNNLNLGIPAIYFSDKATDVGLNLNFDEGGSLKVNMKYDMANSDFSIDLNINKFPINGVEPYMRSGVRVGKLSGALNVDAHMSGNMDHIMNFDLTGNSSISNLVVTDDLNRLVFSADYTSAELKKLNLTENVIHLGTVTGKNMKTQVLLDKEGDNNFTYFTTMPEEAKKIREERAKAREEKAKQDSIAKVNGEENKTAVAETKDTVKTTSKQPDLKLIIDKVDFQNFNCDVRDDGPIKPFTYKLTNTSMEASNVTLDGKNDIMIKGNVGKTGKAFIHWKGYLQDMSNQDIMMNLSNVDLSEFSPYVDPIFAYNITSGNCSLVSQNVITDNNLKGSNLLSIYNCTVEKDKSIENPEIKAPLKTALYIIKDKDGKISFDIPVAGNIDSPEFSYKKIVLKTLGNLLLKVAVSPFRALGKLLGLKKETNDEFSFDPAVPDLQVETYDGLNQAATMLKSKPDLSVSFSQKINYEDLLVNLAMFELKKSYYLKQNPTKKEPLQLIDRDAINNISEKDENLKAYASTLVSDEMAKSIHTKALTLYKQQAIAEADKLAQLHAKQITDYLVNTQGINAAKIKSVVPQYSADDKYSGKNIIKMDCDGD